jgi:integrase
LEALYLLAIHTGLRQGVLLGLNWYDIDPDADTAPVQRSLDADCNFNPPKRNKSRRAVKLTSQAVEALKLHRKHQNEERLRAARWENYGLVFPNRVGKPMDHNNLYHRDFKSLLKRAGL